MRPRFRTLPDILAQQAATLRVRSGVNLPLRAGDVLRSEIEASSLSDADQFVQMGRMPRALSLEGAEGRELDERGIELGIPRQTKLKASVNGHFRRVPGSSGNLNIPANATFYIPATPTSSAVLYRVTSLTTILDGQDDSPDVVAEALEEGTRSNGIPQGTAMPLSSVITNVQDFFTTSASGGGLDDEADDAYRARVRLAPQEAASATKVALEAAARKVALSAGGAVTAIRVIENFRDNRTEIYIDDGSGDDAQIGPEVTSQDYEFTAVGGEVYVRAEQLVGVSVGGSREGLAGGFPITLISAIAVDAVPQVAGVDYFLDMEAGIFAFATPLAAGALLEVTMTTTGGLVEETAKIVRGIPGDSSYPGMRGANEPFMVRAATGAVLGAVVGALSFDAGYDASFGRARARRNILDYVNSRDVGEPARLAKLYEIGMSVPGANNFVITTPTGDISPTVETEVVRATENDIQIS